MGGPIEVRLERFVAKAEGAVCWEWRGTINRYGYGTISVDGKTKLAHRVAYRTWKGPIATGMFLCHTCDNRKCCNPNHLYQGTHLDNMRDMVERGRRRGPNSRTTVDERLAKLRERIKARIIVVGTCWEWQGKKHGGYGIMTVDGRSQRVHREAWKAWAGEIPRGYVVCHSCDNPSCCNPEHLFIGTQADNMKDMSNKGRGSSKVGPKERAAMARAALRGEPTAAIAARYGVTPATVRRWARELGDSDQ